MEIFQWVILSFYGILGFIFLLTALVLLFYLVGWIPNFKEQHAKKLINAFLIELAAAFLGILSHGLWHGSDDIFPPVNPEVTLESKIHEGKYVIFGLLDNEPVDTLIYDPQSIISLINDNLTLESNENQINVLLEPGGQIIGSVPQTDSLYKNVASAEILASYGLYLGQIPDGANRRRNSNKACQYLEAAIEKGGKQLDNELGERVAKTLFHIYVTDGNNVCNPEIVKQAINYYRSKSQRTIELGDVYHRTHNRFKTAAYYLEYMITDDREHQERARKYLVGVVNRVKWPAELLETRGKLQQILESDYFDRLDIRQVIDTIHNFSSSSSG